MQSFRVAPNEEEIKTTNRGGDEYVTSLASWIKRAQRSGNYPLVADLADQYAALDERLRTDTEENLLAVGLLDGFHTIVPMLASCAFALIEAGMQPSAQPDAMSFAGPAFDEAARLHTAVTFTQRQATEDFVHDGVLIPRDTNISMMWLFSNRDPDVFAEPMEYRLDRSNRTKQFGFGGGPYVCAGRNLAKGLGELMLAELVRGSVTIDLAGDVEWVPGAMIHEFKAFPVVVRRA
jgi:cytochrome P450